MVSKRDIKKIQKKTLEQLKLLKDRPEMVVSLLAVLLLVVGVFAAALLASVEQDIRQQAATKGYKLKPILEDSAEAGRIEVNASKNICTNSTCKVWFVE